MHFVGIALGESVKIEPLGSHLACNRFECLDLGSRKPKAF